VNSEALAFNLKNIHMKTAPISVAENGNIMSSDKAIKMISTLNLDYLTVRSLCE
jgi:tRNA-dihydrouridine synthase